MSYFRSKQEIDPVEEKKIYIQNVLTKKFSSEMLTNLNDFIDNICFKVKSDGINYEMLFMAYMCFSNLRLSQFVKTEFGDKTFIQDVINWMKERSEIQVWYELFKTRKNYTIDEHYAALVFYIIIIIKVRNSSESYYAPPVKIDSDSDNITESDIDSDSDDSVYQGA